MTLNQYVYCLNNPGKYVDPSGHKHIVSDYTVVTHEKEYFFNGNRYVRKSVYWTIKKHEFTNLNITVYESGKYYDPFADAELMGYHIDPEKALRGKVTAAISESGSYQLGIGSLVHLDKKYGWKRFWLGGKTTLSFAADIVATVSGYKAVTGAVKTGGSTMYGLIKGAENIIKPGKDITGVNFAVSQGENIMQDKSLFETIKGFFMSFLPFKGTYEGISELRNKKPRVKFGN